MILWYQPYTELNMPSANTSRRNDEHHINGVITYPSPNSARVCIEPPAKDRLKRKTSSRKRATCAVGQNTNRHNACRDACHCACDAVLQTSGPSFPWQWISFLFRRGNCVDLCMPSCSQPGRVVRSEFAGPI